MAAVDWDEEASVSTLGRGGNYKVTTRKPRSRGGGPGWNEPHNY